MSVPHRAIRRTLLGARVDGKYVPERKPTEIPRKFAKDHANRLSRYLLSRHANQKRLYIDPQPNIDAERALRALPQQTRYFGLSSQLRLAHFRDVVARFEVEGFESLLKNGVRYPLEASNDPPLPSELLQRGDSLHRTFQAPSSLLQPDPLDTLELKDIDATVRRLLPAYRPTLEESKQLLRTFNALISRLRSHGYQISAVLTGEGQCIAANAQSPGALLRYVSELRPHDHVVDPSHSAETMASVHRWVLEDETRGGQQRAALSAIFATDQSGTAAIASQAFRSQFVSLDERWRWDYLDVLRRLHGPKAVLAAWSDFQTTAQWKTLTVEESDAATMELASTLHDVVEQLILANEPQLAWVTVHSLSLEPELIPLKTWDLLLETPEYLTQMNEEMQQVLLRIYEQRVERIEDALGVKWTGGEEGSHVLADGGGDPQSLIGGVKTSEDGNES